MIRTLLSIRFRALFAGMTAQGIRREKKQSPGMVFLYIFLYLYLIVVIGGMMCFLFGSLAETYHAIGLDWLYFSMAGLMGLGFSVIGSVFTTQSQLYDAKDNELLLSMPIPPGVILLSRMVPLLALNLLFAGIVMVPAMAMYAILVEFSPVGILLQTVALLAVCALAQAISCLFGWLLHLLLSRMNKSVASMLYLVVFLGVYFYVYSQAEQILSTIAASGEAIAQALRTWVWPLYAMGLGSLESPVHMLGFAAICIACFAAVYLVLSMTFLRTATAKRGNGRKRKLDVTRSKVSSPRNAVVRKELRKFLGTPIYLTNMGLGIVLTAALPIAGLIFRDAIKEFVTLLGIGSDIAALIICAVLSFTVSTCCISTPSVSLEGKNIWILKSMPLSGRDILLSKLSLHMRLTVPVTSMAGGVLAFAFGCGWANALLCALVPGLLAALCGYVGMWAGLKWAKLDYISEAHPCKQSAAILVTMFGMMGVPLLLGLGYAAVYTVIDPSVFLLICTLLLGGTCFGLHRVIITWGVRKWDSL